MRQVYWCVCVVCESLRWSSGAACCPRLVAAWLAACPLPGAQWLEMTADSPDHTVWQVFLPVQPPLGLLQPIILEARGDSVDMCWVDGSMLAAFCAPSITNPRTSEQCSQLAHSYIMKTIFALLDSGLMQEDDIWEPYSAQVGLDWLPLGLAGSDLANAAGGLSPSQCQGLHGAPGTNAMTLMHWFGNRDTAFLRQFRIVHRVSSDGQNIWIALAVGRVDNGEYISRAVDGHITLFYGNERLLPVLNQVLQKLRERVETWGVFCPSKVLPTSSMLQSGTRGWTSWFNLRCMLPCIPWWPPPWATAVPIASG